MEQLITWDQNKGHPKTYFAIKVCKFAGLFHLHRSYELATSVVKKIMNRPGQNNSLKPGFKHQSSYTKY